MAQICIIDDDDGIRETLRIVLEDAGYTVCEAPDGVTALSHLRASDTPMVALLDLLMPGIDGLATLRAVHAGDQRLTRHAYIVVTADTRSLQNDHAHTAIISQTAAGIVHKPFDIDTLLTVVDAAAALLPTPR